MNLYDYMRANKITQQQLADLISKDTPYEPATQGAVSQWLNDGLPPKRVPQLVKIFKGDLSYHDLDPDRFPMEAA